MDDKLEEGGGQREYFLGGSRVVLINRREDDREYTSEEPSRLWGSLAVLQTTATQQLINS